LDQLAPNGSSLGLPPVVLGYMKRDEWPYADQISDAEELQLEEQVK
jgi:hypothetical protein